MKRSVLSIAWLLLGVLTVAAVVMTLGRRDSIANPRIDSFGTSGLAAFAQLLKENGYAVTSTTSSQPALKPGDVAVVCYDEEQGQDLSDESTGIYRHVAAFAKGGGKVVLLPFDVHFSDAVSTVKASSVENPITRAVAKIQFRPSSYSFDLNGLVPDDPVSAIVWQEPGDENPNQVAAICSLGAGLVLSFSDGYLACNRFIDQDQNATVLMSSIKTIAPQGSRLVFTEAAMGKDEPGLIEVLGPSASGAWYQTLFLFVVIIFTLGKRFGLPEETRAVQAGQRELADAVADTYRRAHATRAACRAAYDRADLEVRRALKLASDAPASERDLRVPPGLALEFRRVFEATIDQLSPKDAFERCRALRRQVAAFLSRA